MEIIYTEKKYKGERFVQIKIKYPSSDFILCKYKLLDSSRVEWGMAKSPFYDFNKGNSKPYYQVYLFRNKTEYRVPL